MTGSIHSSIRSEAEFLAQVIGLKSEAEERLKTMADCLQVHNNPQVAEVFHELSSHIAATVAQLERQAQAYDLPEIAPWDYLWHRSNELESLCMEHAHYLMSVREALELVFFNQQHSVAFFRSLEQEAEVSIVQELARQQLAVEKQFAAQIQQRIDHLAQGGRMHDDLDPPHMPE